MDKEKKLIILFIGWVLALSFLVFWGPLAMVPFAMPRSFWYTVWFVLGWFVPSMVGLVLIRRSDGKQGIKEVLKRTFDVRVGWDVLLTLLMMLGILVLGQVLLSRFSTTCFDLNLFRRQSARLLPLFILGPLSEEFGWRGFLQPQMERFFSPLLTSAMIGLIWGIWQYPLFLILGTVQRGLQMSFIPSVVQLMLLSMVFTYAYHHTHKSIGVSILIHWIYGYALLVLSMGRPNIPWIEWISLIPMLLIAVLLLAETPFKKDKRA